MRIYWVLAISLCGQASLWKSGKGEISLSEMSMNCKFSTDFKGRKARESLGGSNCGWRLRRQLFLLWVLVVASGLLWFLYSLNFGALGRKVDTANLCEDKAQILPEHFNISKEELHALAFLFFESDQITSFRCSKKSGFGMSSKNVITCDLKKLDSENQRFEKQRMLPADVDPEDQCLVQDENMPRKHELSLLGDNSVAFASQFMSSSILSNHEENVSRPRVHESLARWHCQSISFWLLEVCWWILIGMAVSCKMPGLQEKLLGNRKRKLFMQQPLGQQQQQQEQQQQQQGQTHSSSTNARKKCLIIFVLAGVIGSIWLFSYLNQGIVLRRKETLANMCDERARMLQDQFNVSMNQVHALAVLVSTFHHEKHPSAIDQKTFGEYTERTAFERPLTSGVAYALRVPHSKREQFEKQNGWTIKKMETEDQTVVQDYIQENLDPAPVHDEYAPVIFSQETVSHIVSIDMMSGKDDRENILRARASGKGVLTSPFKLLKSQNLGVVLTFAVYSTQLPPDATPEQRMNATLGYLGASYDVPSLVEKLLHQLASKQTIVVNVYDTTNRSAQINMYGPDVIDTGLLHISNLDFGDPTRKHEMHCRFKQKPPPPWTAITASFGVLVITLLVGYIFLAAINRIAEVEQNCQKMEQLKLRAEAADVAKSQFLATVSHEIRTPMHGVLGMLQMLMGTNLDTNQLDYAQTAYGNGKDLISLINEVLDLAKIESGRLELEAVTFDLRAILDNVLSQVSTKSCEKGIELAVYVSSKVPQVVIGDPGRFQQIITNLVGNSVKTRWLGTDSRLQKKAGGLGLKFPCGASNIDFGPGLPGRLVMAYNKKIVQAPCLWHSLLVGGIVVGKGLGLGYFR
ncbi:unnamed protein product [Ilex paraguariensis]|uniref:histidine kinase n=1 Tax=Ilex paraguariensis TaxID=185542 RepID=A0ABC8QU08_9AQUA